MKDFHQWLTEMGIDLSERGARTALSPNYPSLYHGKRQNPELDWMPTSATAGLAIQNIKAQKKQKKTSNPWANSFKNVE